MYNENTTLGGFVAMVMRQKKLNNVALANLAGVSEGVIRNLLKHGIDPKAKDPDPRTLWAVSRALDIDTMMLFRLARYLAPNADANSVRAEYVADIFDELSKEKQDAVMGVLEAMTETQRAKDAVQELRRGTPVMDFMTPNLFPAIIREIANQLIAHYGMTTSKDVERIEPTIEVAGYVWKKLGISVQRMVIALIKHKLSLEYDPLMADDA